ncbi:MAG: bacillithiol system redox-active protein YtxJ [Salibacteraceae bacterium]|nr:bacillithiol system redox-active protein YtxJ [Salibacteraceae bacterium]|tara:strand:+ start:17884 stop:18264 length:381 start_codon:yes stop_codon:yes gene_type:complete
MFGNLFGNSKSSALPEGWVELTSVEQAKEAIANSTEHPVLFFKHSTRCPISTMAYRRLETDAPELTSNVNLKYLDLIAYRDVSDWLANTLNVTHQSPQVILVQNKEVVHIATHSEINGAEIIEVIA